MNSLNGGNNKKYILCTDGLYSSEELLDNNNFYFIGAIRSNRIKSNKIEILEKIKKKSHEYFYRVNGNKYYTLTKYNDSKPMYVISNFVDVPEEVKRTRWSKEEKKFIFEKFPNTIKKYTQYMKGVDKSNQLISYYEINRKTYKWWKRIFYHLIDVSIVNSFIIFKKINNTSITQKNYRLEIVREIIKKYNITIGDIKPNQNEIHYPVNMIIN